MKMQASFIYQLQQWIRRFVVAPNIIVLQVEQLLHFAFHNIDYVASILLEIISKRKVLSIHRPGRFKTYNKQTTTHIISFGCMQLKL